MNGTQWSECSREKGTCKEIGQGIVFQYIGLSHWLSPYFFIIYSSNWLWYSFA